MVQEDDLERPYIWDTSIRPDRRDEKAAHEGETFLLFAPERPGFQSRSPNYTVLSAYSDASSLAGEIRSACASIVFWPCRRRWRKAYACKDPVTRAEFVTHTATGFWTDFRLNCASADAYCRIPGGGSGRQKFSSGRP